MNKKVLFTALFAVIAIAGQAKTYKRIIAPNAMACVNVHYGELKAREVIMTDTATTVHFTMTYRKGGSFRFVKESYLLDEDGKRYPLRSAEGIALDEWVTAPEGGLDFTMHFEPLPKRTQIFDFIEGDVNGAFMLLGIHDKKTKLKIPTLQELTKANPYTVPADWFKTDTITIRGRIEGYDAERFGFTSMECYFEDVFEKDGGALVLDITPEGTFEKKFQASYPIHDSFNVSGSKVDFRGIPFFARPGETIDITVKPNERGQYECYYNSGSSKEVERWLKSNIQSMNLMNALGHFEGKFAEANQKADEVWQNMLYRINVIGRREHFTPMEMQLALAESQTWFACAYMDYAMYYEDELRKDVKRDDGYYETLITDSAEWEAIRDEKSYKQLRRIDFDNPMMFVSSSFRFTLNRIQYSVPVRYRKYESFINGNGVYEANVESERKSLTNGRASWRELMGTDKDNLMSQLCIYKDMLSNFNSWRNNEEALSKFFADTTRTVAEREEAKASSLTLSNMMPLYLAVFTHPYICQKAEQFYANQMAQTELSTPLPENNPAADLIRSLCAKYPGRFLVIDFWGMGCGPCRSAIQRSKDKRAEIAKRDDVKLVFVAGENTAEGSESYHNYVKEWLADEETVCITHDDFRRLQELFKFNSIPHYETITPDCRRVRDDLKLDGLYNFDNDINQVIERLK